MMATQPHSLKAWQQRIEHGVSTEGKAVQSAMPRDYVAEILGGSPRAALANQVGADLFISIHANGFTNRQWSGVETFFHSIEASGEEARRVASKENAQDMASTETGDDEVSFILQDMRHNERLKSSSRLAQVAQERLAAALKFTNRGVMQADFAVLRQTRMPAILVEIGFITNPPEEQLLREPKIQERAAAALRDAVVEYRSLLEKQEVRPPSEASR